MDTTIPRLAPPGAGLPTPELLIGRTLFWLRRRFGSRTSMTADFRAERGRIGTLVDRCPTDHAAMRVLIARPKGLEDSSRHWSVLMTLDHLRIVNLEIARVIASLARGTMPGGKASTAAVKPDASVDAAVRTEYERSCDDLLATVERSGDLKTALRYAHPWFGPLDAAGWHALSGTHMRIHRVQIERIVRGLAASRRPRLLAAR